MWTHDYFNIPLVIWTVWDLCIILLWPNKQLRDLRGKSGLFRNHIWKLVRIRTKSRNWDLFGTTVNAFNLSLSVSKFFRLVPIGSVANWSCSVCSSRGFVHLQQGVHSFFSFWFSYSVLFTGFFDTSGSLITRLVTRYCHLTLFVTDGRTEEEQQ